jgi:hypothetical protein
VKVYEEIHGEDAEVPRNFVVPVDDPRYPEVAKSFELGAWLLQFNRRNNGLLPFQIQDAKKKKQQKKTSPSERHRQPRGPPQGALTPHAEQYWKDVLLASFQAYAKLHDSCEDMDGSFIVPSEEPYPQSAWGLNLGLRLRHVRHGVRYAREIGKYKGELVELGVLFDGDDASMELGDDQYATREFAFEDEDFDDDFGEENEEDSSDEEEHN